MRTISASAAFVSPVLLALLAPLLLMVGSCSSPPPEPTYYLLRGAAVERVDPVEGDVRVGLSRIVVAPYLMESRGIVVETAPSVVRPARQHQWAEPLDASLHWFLHGELSRALGDRVGAGLVDFRGWDYAVDVYVVRLHATLSGRAELEAAYVIRSRADVKATREYRIASSVALADDGYPGVVAAERELLVELGAAIVSSLREVMQPDEPDAMDESEDADAFAAP